MAPIIGSSEITEQYCTAVRKKEKEVTTREQNIQSICYNTDFKKRKRQPPLSTLQPGGQLLIQIEIVCFKIYILKRQQRFQKHNNANDDDEQPQPQQQRNFMFGLDQILVQRY